MDGGVGGWVGCGGDVVMWMRGVGGWRGGGAATLLPSTVLLLLGWLLWW